MGHNALAPGFDSFTVIERHHQLPEKAVGTSCEIFKHASSRMWLRLWTAACANISISHDQVHAVHTSLRIPQTSRFRFRAQQRERWGESAGGCAVQENAQICTAPYVFLAVFCVTPLRSSVSESTYIQAGPLAIK